MIGVAGVTEVHDLHVWEVTSGFPALSAHVLVGASRRLPPRARAARRSAARPVRDRAHDAAGRPRGWGPAEHRGALSVIRGTGAAMRPIVLAVVVFALFVSPAAAQTTDTTPIVSADGIGVATLTPDIADFSVTVSRLAPTSAARPHGREPPRRRRAARRPSTAAWRTPTSRTRGLSVSRERVTRRGRLVRVRYRARADAGDPRAQRRRAWARCSTRSPRPAPTARATRTSGSPTRRPGACSPPAPRWPTPASAPTTPRRPRGCGSPACAR